MPGSFPVEVAWAGEAIPLESYLIKPCSQWLADSSRWSHESQDIHGLSLETLLEHGEDHGKVAQRMLEVIDQVNVIYSDNPYYEQMWMDELFDSAGVSHWHQFSALNGLLYAMTDVATVQGAYCQARRTSPPTHRAASDVAYLLEVYRICQEYEQ